ncbi:MAG: hypothetical protein BWY59_00878 [Verrucomicrobia bacterium ADurb.Bin345]|nr:MAG: hypothetical protein BWY59_00878 [Verrucomicrobia bacterium ADurb.Bin345]
MQLDIIGAGFRAGVDLFGVGVDKHADPDAGILEPGRHLGEAAHLPGHVESTFGGDLLAVFGHEADGLRADTVGNADDLVDGGHLQIEARLQHLFQQVHVAVLNVASVLPEVHGDLMGACQFAQFGGGNQVGLHAFPCFPQRSHVVDVDSQLDHGDSLCPTARQPVSPAPGPAIRLPAGPRAVPSPG